MRSRIYRGNNSFSGFTLVELLSAMVLMSLIMSLAAMSLSQFSQYGEKSGLGFNDRINRYLNLERLNDVVGRALDYYVKDNLEHTRLFFRGDSELFSFVSGTSWDEDNRASLSILAIEESNDGLKSLVLYQKKLTEQVFFEVSQFPDKDQLNGALILDGASEITFEYLGVRDFRQLYSMGTTDNYRKDLVWDKRFDGLESGYLPEIIKINVKWPNGTTWPCLIKIKAMNYSKRSLMLDGTS